MGCCGHYGTWVLGWGVGVGTAVHGHQGYAGYTRVLGTHRGTGVTVHVPATQTPVSPHPTHCPAKCALREPPKIVDRSTWAGIVSPALPRGIPDTCGLPVAFAP